MEAITTTSALPAPQRVWPTVSQSSCRDPIEMPSASPAGTQPFMISLVKSCPDRSEVNGARRARPWDWDLGWDLDFDFGDTGGAPGARMAVPMALNSRPPAGNDPMVSRTPTTPWPPRSAHSVVIRSMALCRAWYIACTSGPKDPKPPREETWVTVRAGMPYPKDPQAPGQL